MTMGNNHRSEISLRAQPPGIWKNHVNTRMVHQEMTPKYEKQLPTDFTHGSYVQLRRGPQGT